MNNNCGDEQIYYMLSEDNLLTVSKIIPALTDSQWIFKKNVLNHSRNIYISAFTGAVICNEFFMRKVGKVLKISNLVSVLKNKINAILD